MSQSTPSSFSPSTGRTYFAPNDSYEAQGFDAASEAEYLAWCDETAKEVTDADFDRMQAEQQAREVEAWFNCPDDVHFAA
jgi:hypothetical protein